MKKTTNNTFIIESGDELVLPSVRERPDLYPFSGFFTFIKKTNNNSNTSSDFEDDKLLKKSIEEPIVDETDKYVVNLFPTENTNNQNSQKQTDEKQVVLHEEDIEDDLGQLDTNDILEATKNLSEEDFENDEDDLEQHYSFELEEENFSINLEEFSEPMQMIQNRQFPKTPPKTIKHEEFELELDDEADFV